MRIPSGSTDRYIYFVAVDPTDLKTREQTLSTFTVYGSLNGAAASLWSTPTVNETDTTNMPGVYELLLDEQTTLTAGNDTEELCLHITQAAMAPVTRTVEIYRPETTEGNTLDVTATGAAGVDWGNVENKTTSNDLTGTTIATTQKVDVETIKTNPVVNGGTITFPTTATLASTTNITAGTIATVTNLTNAPTNGDLTATMKTSVTTAATASTPIAASVSGNVDGSVASVVGAVGSVTGLTASNLDATVSSRMPTTHINATTGNVDQVTLCVTTTNNTDMVAAAPTINQIWDEAMAGHVTADSAAVLLKDVPSTSEFDARTLPTASYFDPTTDTVANVTLTATTTAVTNDVGITQAGADKAWSTASRVLTAGTNLNDIAAADVWAVDATTQQTQGTFGQAIGDPVADTTTIYQAVATDATGDNVSVDVVALKAETVLIVEDTGTTIPGTITTLQSDTDDIQTRLPAALVNSRMDATIDATGFEDAAVDKVWDEDIVAAHNTADTAGAILNNILPEKNAAFADIEWLWVAASDHVTPVTAASTMSVTRSIDGGSFGAGTGTGPTEVANGIYVYDASAADMNGTVITFRFVATGGTPGAPDDAFVTIKTSG